MHIVFDARTNTPHFPGIGRYVRGLLGTLPSMLAPDERLTILENADGGLPLDLAVTVGRVRLRGGPVSILAQQLGRRDLARLQPDVVHTPYFLSRPPCRGRAVLTLHDVIPLTHPAQSNWRARMLTRLRLPRALRQAARVIAVSQAALDTAHDVLPLLAWPPVCVIHHGVEPRFCPPPPPDVAELRRRLALPASFTLCCGSDRPHKNLQTLLVAQARAGPGALPLVVAGMQSADGPTRRRVRRLGLDSTRVRWLGTVSETDLPVLYGAATALLFPSRAEGFGLPVLEALACGTRVVASDIAALRETGGTLVRYVSPDDIADWQAAILALADPAPPRDERAWKRHLASFTWTRTAEATLEVYRAANEPLSGS